MNVINIKCNLESPQKKNIPVKISAGNEITKDLSYKFIIGLDGTWKTLRDFGKDTSIEWVPTEEGRFIIMVQGKTLESEKPFDYISRMEFVIGEKEERLIENFYLEKDILKLGDILMATAETSKNPVMFRFLLKDDDTWQVIRDYSPDNTMNFTAKKSGKHQIKVECKSLESKEAYDDFKEVTFEVEKINKVEIVGFKSLGTDLLVDSELDFQVEVLQDESRTILYKFIKIDSEGGATCIQDYSTKRGVSFTENNPGSYKLLCLVKDMYSNQEYDDRAVLGYKIKIYNSISIQSFTTDLNSPQICETTVILKPIVKGGRNLLYRFIIDGNQGEDSGYSRNSTFSWNTKKSGKYKLILWVKDVSYEGNYQATETIDFEVDEISNEPVNIVDVIFDKSDKVLKGQMINVKVVAEGGNEIRYSFVVKKENVEIEKIEYGTCNWVNFTPEEKGNYELEILAKDKYSKREFDSSHNIFFEACNFIPASIDYVLIPHKEHYIPGNLISMDIIARNTKEVLVKYVLNINGNKVEETDFVENKKYAFTPNYAGRYQVILHARSKGSDNEYDYKKEINIDVEDALPVINTKITSDKDEVRCNENINFMVSHQGGKDVIYEFYLWDKNEWRLAQSYSINNNYSLIPFNAGEFKLLVNSKSKLSKLSYEDYDIFEFNVEA